MAQAKQAGWFLYLVLGLVLFGCYATLKHDGPKTPEEQHAASLYDAKIACRAAVVRLLNDPGSAQWQTADTWPISEISPDDVGTIALLRAKNAFGAVMSAQFRCVVHHNAAGWDVQSVDQIAP